jgi:hypothetical protein
VVIGDSLTFCDDVGPRKFNSPILYPSMVANRLSENLQEPWRLAVLAKYSWSVYWAERHIRSSPEAVRSLQEASLVVVALGGIDSVSVATPRGFGVTSFKKRPGQRLRENSLVKRLAFMLLLHGYSAAVRVFGGRFRHTPPRALRRSFRQLVALIRQSSPGTPIVWLLPSEGTLVAFGGEVPFRDDVCRELADLTEANGIPVVDSAKVVREWGGVQPDGAHWPAPVHERMADAVFEVARRALVPDYM